MLKKIFLLCIIFVGSIQGTTAKIEKEKAEVFIIEIGNAVTNLLTDKSFSQQEKASQFKNILETKFNLKAIGKFVLGRYWKNASQEEKERFFSLFKSATIATYTTRFGEYTSEKFEIIGSRIDPDEGVTVLTRLVRPKGQVILIDWKIFEKQGNFQIYDIILEGISMGITQRSEYAAVIQQAGGKIQPLLEALEKKAKDRAKN